MVDTTTTELTFKSFLIKEEFLVFYLKHFEKLERLKAKVNFIPTDPLILRVLSALQARLCPLTDGKHFETLFNASKKLKKFGILRNLSPGEMQALKDNTTLRNLNLKK